MQHRVRRADTIHREQGGWFDARWHFAFGGYLDGPRGIGPLRVFNDDEIVAGAQWPMHPHADIESLTWVAEGRFEHVDSLGNGGAFEAGAAQVMRFSSRGAEHSERNGSQDEPVRFLQFWLLAEEETLASSVEQRQWTTQDRTDRWLRIMSGNPLDDALWLSVDATVDVARATAGTELTHTFGARRGGYLYVVDGTVELGGTTLHRGDAVAFDDGDDGTGGDLPRTAGVRATTDSELFLVDVPLDFTPVERWRGR